MSVNSINFIVIIGKKHYLDYWRCYFSIPFLVSHCLNYFIPDPWGLERVGVRHAHKEVLVVRSPGPESPRKEAGPRHSFVVVLWSPLPRTCVQGVVILVFDPIVPPPQTLGRYLTIVSSEAISVSPQILGGRLGDSRWTDALRVEIVIHLDGDSIPCS